jgi:hypothetical protein
MIDPTESQPEPKKVDGDVADPSAGSGQPSSTDHHALVAYVGVMALVLLLIGAVGVSAFGGPGSSGAKPGHQGLGHAFGHQKHADQLQRRAERQAEKQEQMQARKERQRELKEQRQSGALGPEVAEALSEQTGVIATQTDADGTTVYVLRAGGATLVLDVGPPRFWGETHPLAPFVGQTVTVTGVQKAGSDRFAVFTVGDTVIRGPGRPPWAGGWKADGQTTPMPSPGTSPTPSAAP